MMNITVLTASSGIGAKCALAFAESAQEMTLISRKEEDLLSLKQEIQSKFKEVKLNTSSFNIGEKLDHDLIQNTDVLIYTIGYLSATYGKSESEDIDTLYDVNLKESVKIIEAFAASMKAKSKGSLIVVSSVAGERGKVSHKMYNSAKAGMTTYLDGLRQEMKPFGVHVMTVKPGYVKTKMLGDMETPGFLTADPHKLGQYIFKAFKRKKAVIYYKPIWRYIMWIIKHIPVGIYKNLKL